MTLVEVNRQDQYQTVGQSLAVKWQCEFIQVNQDAKDASDQVFKRFEESLMREDISTEDLLAQLEKEINTSRKSLETAEKIIRKIKIIITNDCERRKTSVDQLYSSSS